MLPVIRRHAVRALVACVLVAASAARAQSVSGSIAGTVVDQTRQVLPGAAVTLINDQTGESRTTPTNAIGVFVFSAVRPGTYTLRIELAGFSTFERKQTV